MSFLTNVVKVLEALGIKNKSFNDKRYVNTTGDLMTGGLGIQPSVDSLTALVVNDKDANNVLTVNTVNNMVGIGTTNPQQELDVVGDIRLSGEILGTNTTYTRLNVANGAGGQAYDISASTRTSTGASSERLRITGGTDVGIVSISNSNLGIGTTNPGAPLEVIGNIKATTFNSHTLSPSSHTFNGYTISGTGAQFTFNYPISALTVNGDTYLAKTSGNVGIGTASPTAKLQINSIASYESATLGSELLSASNWTLGTGWSGDFATGFAHTSGTANLSNTLAGVIGNYYQITYTVTGRTAGSFTITFGGESFAGRTATGAFGPRATTTENLIITPTTDFNGTVIISIKQITANYGATFALNDSTGASSFEIRNSLASLANTFIGVNSGRKNTTGINNSSLGNNSLLNNTTGYNNSAQGYEALRSNTTGNYNSAQGFQALSYNTTGAYNSAQGVNALYSNTTGSNNSAQGANALRSNTTGYTNSAQGANALYSNTTGNYNSAQGLQALRSNTTGYNNSAQGVNALYSNTTGNNNSAQGYEALRSNTTGNYNSAQGRDSLYSNKTGSNGVAIGFESQRYANDTTTPWTNYNTSIGYQALRGSTTAANNTGNFNTAIGYNSLYSTSSGASNTALGYSTLTANTTGSGNLALGYAALTSLNGSNNIALGSNSGRYYNGTTGNLTTSDGSLFLGALSSALANGSTNEIVIGYNAIGLGSNTIKLGNTSITNVASNGDFEALDIGDGFILKSPDGTRYRITVANGGALSAVEIQVPS